MKVKDICPSLLKQYAEELQKFSVIDNTSELADYCRMYQDVLDFNLEDGEEIGYDHEYEVDFLANLFIAAALRGGKPHVELPLRLLEEYIKALSDRAKNSLAGKLLDAGQNSYGPPRRDAYIYQGITFLIFYSELVSKKVLCDVYRCTIKSAINDALETLKIEQRYIESYKRLYCIDDSCPSLLPIFRDEPEMDEDDED